MNGPATDRRPPPASAPGDLRGRSGWAQLPARVQPSRLLLLAADGRGELIARLREARRRAAAGEDLADLADGPSAERGGHRLAIVAADAADLERKIGLALDKLSGTGTRLALQGSVYYTERQPDADAGTAFLFPGQGSQHPGMLDELCLLLPRVRGWIEELDRTLADLPVPPPSLLAYPPSDGLSEEERGVLGRELLGMRGGAQLSLVADLALFEVVSELGIACDAMLGHSNGEHAALFASQTFRADRGRLFAAMRAMVEQAIAMPPPQPPERVITVGTRDRRRLDEVLAATDGLHLAMINCPTQVVLAGREDAVESAGRQLAAAGAIVVPVPLDRAYHTPLFAAWGSWLRGLYERTEVGRGTRRLYSGMTAGPYPAEAEEIRDLAAAQWTRTVDFERAVRRLYDDGVRVFVEVGPGNKLTGFVADVLRDREHLAVATSSPQHPPVQQLQRLVAVLFVHARPLDLRSATARRLLRPHAPLADEDAADEPAAPPAPPAGEPDPRLGLFLAHQTLMREFLDSQARVLAATVRRAGTAAVPLAAPVVQPARSADTAIFEWPLLGDEVEVDGRRLVAVRRFDLERDPLLRDHSLGARDGEAPGGAVHPLAVLPFTFTLEIVAEAALRLAGGRGMVSEISAARGTRWLALDRGSLRVRVLAEADPARPGRARVRVFELAGDREHLAFEAEAEVSEGPPAAPFREPAPSREPPPLHDPAPPQRWSVEGFYRDFAFHGPSFRGIRRVAGVAGEDLEAELEALPRPPPAGRPGAPGLLLDPALLDCVGQLVGFWLLEGGRQDFGIFPFSMRRLRIFGPAPAPGQRFRARARVLWQEHGATRADVEIAHLDGRTLYLVEGFEQRYVAFPPALARALFGAAEAGRDRFVSGPEPANGDLAARSLEGIPHPFLADSWGIWGRALAHRTLSSTELDEWYDRNSCSVPWLLSRLVAKEAVRSWAAAAHGLDLPLGEVVLAAVDAGTFAVRHPVLATLPPEAAVRVERQDERIVARLVG